MLSDRFFRFDTFSSCLRSRFLESVIFSSTHDDGMDFVCILHFRSVNRVQRNSVDA
jgi:hypothetical protein